MTTEQNKLADRIIEERVGWRDDGGRLGVFFNGSDMDMIVAALRAAGEPVAWLYNTRGDQKWRVTMDRPVQTDRTAFDKILPLGPIATQPAPSASVRGGAGSCAEKSSYSGSGS